MSNSKYKMYVDDTIKLVESIVIKSSVAAEIINNVLREFNIAISPDPSEWKYYMNLNGQYHSVDTIMYVQSVDVMDETIIFNKANLKIHRATALEYKKGTPLYNNLVNTYPNQKRLIDKILCPIPMAKLLSARDYSIVGYDKNLIKPNEITLLKRIGDYIDRYSAKWYMPDYVLSDKLYYTSFLGGLYLHMPNEILNIRIDACGTAEAHEFHMLEHLDSHGRLADMAHYLTTEQQLFLYRNIVYIQENVGKQSILELLADKLLYDRGMPLYKYTVQHNLENINTDLVPAVEVIKYNMNPTVLQPIADKITVADCLEKQSILAPGNAIDIERDTLVIENKMQNSLTNVLHTKILESEIIDYSGSLNINIIDILYNHWLFYASSKIYLPKLNIINTYVGETYKLDALDAFVLYIYCVAKSLGVTPIEIKSFVAADVMRLIPPTVGDLIKVGTPPFLTEADAETALADIPPTNRLTHPRFFYDKCYDIYERHLMHRNQWLVTGNLIRQGQVNNMVESIYQDVTCKVTEVETFQEWLYSKDIDLGTMEREDYGDLADLILSIATGTDINPYGKLYRTQSAMLGIIERLTSYNIHFIKTTLGYPNKYIDICSMGIANNSASINTEQPINIALDMPLAVTKRTTEYAGVDIPDMKIDELIFIKDSDNIDIGISVTENVVEHHKTHIHLGEFTITERVN